MTEILDVLVQIYLCQLTTIFMQISLNRGPHENAANFQCKTLNIENL